MKGLSGEQVEKYIDILAHGIADAKQSYEQLKHLRDDKYVFAEAEARGYMKGLESARSSLQSVIDKT